MAEITISELPAKTSLLDSDLIVIDDGTQSYRVTGAQLREFLKVNFLSVGTVVWSQSALATDNPGRLPLWTGEYIASASTIYPDFYSWVKNKHPELCKTKEQYDAALTQFGECPFYVVDEENGSLRLPKLANYIKMANTVEGITQGGAGLPDITGTLSGAMHTSGNATGAFAKEEQLTNYSYNGGAWVSNVSFDASRSSEVYGNSDTVTPSHTTLYPWVFAYNATVPASTAQASEFQEGLSGKADTNLGNIPTNYDYVVESYSDGEGNWYRVYKSGWVEQGGLLPSSKGTAASATVTFLKPFLNTSYFFTYVCCWPSYVENGISIKDLTTEGLTIPWYASTDNPQSRWYACGKGA